MKPLFYHLAKHGPWNHHVRIMGSEAYNELCSWLLNNGKHMLSDWESINYDIGAKNTGRQAMQHIFFFNDARLASYVKLTWGRAK